MHGWCVAPGYFTGTAKGMRAHVRTALDMARLMALRKPDGGVRGIATGDAFRRLVARTPAKQWATVFDEATRPYQFALQAWAGTDALAAHVRVARSRDRGQAVGPARDRGAGHAGWTRRFRPSTGLNSQTSSAPGCCCCSASPCANHALRTLSPSESACYARRTTRQSGGHSKRVWGCASGRSAAGLATCIAASCLWRTWLASPHSNLRPDSRFTSSKKMWNKLLKKLLTTRKHVSTPRCLARFARQLDWQSAERTAAVDRCLAALEQGAESTIPCLRVWGPRPGASPRTATLGGGGGGGVVLRCHSRLPTHADRASTAGRR